MEKEFPRYLIGYNQEHINVFLQLLAQGNEESKLEVVHLLEMLPINQEIKEFLMGGIDQAQKAGTADWESMFLWNGQDIS